MYFGIGGTLGPGPGPGPGFFAVIVKFTVWLSLPENIGMH